VRRCCVRLKKSTVCDVTEGCGKGKGLGKRGRQSFLPARKSELGRKGSLELINGRLFAHPHLDPAAARGGVESDELTVLVIAWAK
jgi:hypothetical protein